MGQLCRVRAGALSAVWPVHRFTEIDSTNAEAKRRAAAGAFQDQWIVADSQSAGRGRQDRVWASPAGNIFATALFTEPGGIKAALRVPFTAALAVTDTVLNFAPNAPVKVKWPNDVRIDRRKISGILVETGGAGAQMWIAAGIGLNLMHVPGNVDQQATCLASLAGESPPYDAVLETLQRRFQTRLAQFRTNSDTLGLEWLQYAEGLGETISVRTGSGFIEGVFEGLEADGALRLRLPDGAARSIRAGEVNLIGRT